MRMRIGRGRSILLTASLLVLVSGAAVAGNGMAAAASPTARPAAGNTITFTTFPADQVIGSLPAAVSLPVVAADSDPTQTLTYSATGLPAGVTIDPATGTISGTVTAAFTGTTTVTATDTTEASASEPFSWTAADTITVTAPADQTTATDTTIAPLAIAAVTTGVGQTLAYAATGLPPDLTIDPATGVISGTTTAAAGPYDVVVSVTDGTGSPAGTADFEWTVEANTITFTTFPADQAIGSLPAAVSLPVVAADSDPAKTLTYSAAGLPAGVTINPATGTISGTVTAAFAGTTTVTATDTTEAFAADTFTWTAADTILVTAPADQTTTADTTIKPLAIAATTTGVGRTLAYAATGLPPDLAIDPATGVISGTTTDAVGLYDVVVSVTDGTGSPAGTADFTWDVPDNTITVTAPADQSSPPNTKVSLQVKATDSAAGQVLAYSAAGLPPTLTINPATGLISGTTAESEVGNTYTVTVTVTNDTSEPATVTFAWSIAFNKITVTVPRTEQSKLGVTIVPVIIKAKDAAPGQRLTYTASGLPSGLAVNHTTGVITGKPRALTSVVTTTVTVTDSTGSTGAAVIRWQVGAAITIPDPGGQVISLGQPVDLPLTASANVAHYPLTLRVSGLPPGVGFQDRPWLVSGWPMRSGTYHVAVTATGKDGGVTVLRFPIRVRPAPDSGATGPIDLDIAGMCLDDPGNRSAAGTMVDLAACDGATGQQWTMAVDGTIRIHGKCMTIVRGTMRLESCGAWASQTWVTGTDAELVNPAAGRCLADPRSSARNGTRPVLAYCTTAQDELWVAPGSMIFSGLMGMCADDHFSSGVNGNVIDEFFCNGSPAQSWQLLPDGTMRIFGNKCMTVAGAAGRIGAKIELYTCAAGDASQHWRIFTHGTFVAQIENGGACLAVPGNTSTNGTQLRLARCAVTAPTDSWHD
jgi:hypothetical protein